MVSIKDFSALLQTTVTADRLSGSKIQALREQALGLAEKGEDVELITKFFKLNSSLPAASSSRISSLYVFDAIARDAKTASVGKDVGKGKGKAAAAVPSAAAGGLLMKMEGVVESWVSGMVEDGKGGVWDEGKEKMQKVLDIWTKSSTFPQNTLDRLQAKVKSANFASSSKLTPNIVDPPPPVMSPALPPLDDVGGAKGGARNGLGPEGEYWCSRLLSAFRVFRD